MVRLLAILACLWAATATTASADTPAASRLTELTTGDATRGWEAVGRLDLGHGSFCTASLIAPDQVLTAAHCLFHSETGERIPVADMEFRAGWRNGRAEAYRKVRRAVAHPDYDYTDTQRIARVSRDLAILQLDRPIRSGKVQPFPTADVRMRKGAEVTIVSYAEDRAEAPSLQQICFVLESFGGVGMLSCSVDFGSSGAPIFMLDETGPRIVSVVSAKSEADGTPVALVGELRPSLAKLQHAFDMPATEVRAGNFRLTGGSATGGIGAKFVRP